MVTRIALLAGALGLLLGMLPSASAGQWVGLVLGATAAALGWIRRRRALSRGLTGAVASAASALGLLAVLVSAVGLVACQSAPIDGGREPLAPEFRRRIEGALGPTQHEVGAEVDVDR